MFTVYVLYSKTIQKKYTGFTQDLERRMMDYRNNQSFVTSAQKSLMDVYTRNKDIQRNSELFSMK
ncbi:MAG: hypothetical protein EBV23_05350 [Flavobacteriia bacterium]|nr:hypothetical protein [Flavobacteriia bacterium]